MRNYQLSNHATINKLPACCPFRHEIRRCVFRIKSGAVSSLIHENKLQTKFYCSKGYYIYLEAVELGTNNYYKQVVWSVCLCELLARLAKEKDSFALRIRWPITIELCTNGHYKKEISLVSMLVLVMENDSFALRLRWSMPVQRSTHF